eukprot:NODE_36_length_31474_cov_0.342438.p18 type:complete len:211 gc:universal NODE_36_length_31474_cov_0.342438:15630-16262(+)
MFTLSQLVYDKYTQLDAYNVLIIGLDNSGKSTLIECVKSMFTNRRALHTLVPTVGLNTFKFRYKLPPNIDYCIPVPAKIHLTFWDLGGQTELQQLWSTYYPDSHAILYLIDSTDHQRLKSNVQILKNVLLNQDADVPLLLLANKQDSEQALPIHQIKEIVQNPLAEYLDVKEAQTLGVSALQGDGVREALSWVVNRMQLNKGNRPPNSSK